MSSYGVVLFYNTSGVMRAEKVLQKGGVVVKLIPTPDNLAQFSGTMHEYMGIAWYRMRGWM